jgi:hypothetical protein
VLTPNQDYGNPATAQLRPRSPPTAMLPQVYRRRCLQGATRADLGTTPSRAAMAGSAARFPVGLLLSPRPLRDEVAHSLP